MLIKDVRGMDCQTSKENIELYIDGVLSSAQTEELYAHADTCSECKKELENSLRLKKALAALGRLEAPEGLAKEAIRKARKKSRVPFAYISAAAAAMIALVVILTSGVLPNAGGGAANKGVQESILMAVPEDGGVQDEAYAMDMAPAPAEAPAEEMAPAATEAPAAEKPAASDVTIEPEEMFAVQTQEVPKVAGDTDFESPDYTVYVPDDLAADIRVALENMIIEYGFEYKDVSDGMTDSISFVITEDIIDLISELTADLPLDGVLTEGQIIEFVFSNQ